MIMYHYEPGHFEMYKADSGAVRFKLRYAAEHGQGMLSLVSKTSPNKILYDVSIGPVYIVLRIRTGSLHRDTRSPLPAPMGTEFTEFWLTWYGCAIHIGTGSHTEPLVSYKHGGLAEYNIGYIKFYIRSLNMPVEWEFEASPVILRAPKEKIFEDDLQWKELITVERNGNNKLVLPNGAMIGGFENEPIYIARAPLFGSLCIGKYVPSKSKAFLPWGESEHTVPMCEILCGVNGKWVKTRGNYVPENAFVGGYSEVREEPLYVGRAMHNNCLLLGKVHTLYSACYLPYCGKELCVSDYEILIKPNVECRGKLVRQKKSRISFERLLLDPEVFRERRHLVRMLRLVETMREQRTIHGRLGSRPMSQRDLLEILGRYRIPQDPGALQLAREDEQAMQEQRGQEVAEEDELRVPQRGLREAQAPRPQQVGHALNMLGREQGIPYRGQAVALGDVPQRGQADAQRAQPVSLRRFVAQGYQEEAQRALALAQAAPQRDQVVAQRPERGQGLALPAQEEPQRNREVAQAAQVEPQREIVERGQGVVQGVRDLRIPPGVYIPQDLREPYEGQGVARDLRIYLPGRRMPQGGQEMPRDLRVPQDRPEAPPWNLEIPQARQRMEHGGQPQEALRVALPPAARVALAPAARVALAPAARVALPPAARVALAPAARVALAPAARVALAPAARVALPPAARVELPQAAVQQWGVATNRMPVGALVVGRGRVEPPPVHWHQAQVAPPPYPGRNEVYWAFIRDQNRAARPNDMPF